MKKEICYLTVIQVFFVAGFMFETLNEILDLFGWTEGVHQLVQIFCEALPIGIVYL